MHSTLRCEDCQICEISLFKTLGQTSLSKLSDSKNDSFYKKGQIIYNELNVPSGVYAVSSGSVKLYKEGVKGKEQIINLAGPGAVLGYRAILCNQTFGVSAAALEDVSLCFIPKQVFQEILIKDVQFSQSLLQELSEELGKSRQQIVGLAQKTAKEKISETLLQLKVLYGEDAESGFLNKSLSRTHVAQLCGITLESAVREMKSLEKEGFITLDKKSLRINQSVALANLAGLDF